MTIEEAWSKLAPHLREVWHERRVETACNKEDAARILALAVLDAAVLVSTVGEATALRSRIEQLGREERDAAD